MAFFSSSDNDVNVKVSSTADTKGLDETTQSVNRLEQSSGMGGKAAAALGIAGKAAVTGVAALGVATGAAGVMALKSSSDFEQNRIAFEVMLGSADKARSLMNQIAQFAKETPFELPEVVAGSKQLLAFGFAQEQIIPTMRKLGDIAAGVGVPVGQLAYVFGQVKVAGKLMGGDLMQFTNAGVPMIEGLSKVLKVSQGDVKKMVETGKVGFKDVEQVINNMTKSGSQFGGMMDKQSQSLGGIWSNLKDGFSGVLRGAMGVSNAGDIIKGGLFDKIKGAASDAMPVIQKMSEQAGPFMSRAMENTGKAIGQFVSALKSIWNVVGPVLMPSIKALWQTIETKLWPTFIKLLPTLKDLAIIAGGILVAGIWLFINALNIAINIVSWLGRVIAETRDGILAAFDWIVAKAGWLKDNFWSVVGEIIGFFATLPIKIPALIIDAIAKVAMFLWNYKWSDLWSGLINSGKNAALEIWWAINGAWQKMVGLNWGAIMANVGKGIANAIIDMINGGIKGSFKGVPILKDHIPQIPHFARGVRNFGGGMALVGEEGPELVNLGRGSDVFSNHDSKQMMGGQTTYNIQQVVLEGAEATRAFFSIQDRNGVLASKGMSTVRT